MPLTAIQPVHYTVILERIRENCCVPFLGAGVNKSGDGYDGLPLGHDVALQLVRALTGLDEQQLEDLARGASDEVQRRLIQTVAGLDAEELDGLADEDLEERLAGVGPSRHLLRVALYNLARVALHVEVETDPGFLVSRLRQILPDEQRQPSPLLQTLAELPFELIVTTNYDRLLERALGERPHELVVQPVAGFDELAQTDLQKRLSAPRGVIVYKIHGSFRDNGGPPGQQARDDLLITEEDYIQFLTVVSSQNRGVPELISEKMVGSTLLFLGYSLEDWDFRTIYKALIEPIPTRSRPVSYAIQKNPEPFWVRYWDRKGITILDVDLYEFAAELGRRYQALAGA